MASLILNFKRLLKILYVQYFWKQNFISNFQDNPVSSFVINQNLIKLARLVNIKLHFMDWFFII